MGTAADRITNAAGTGIAVLATAAARRTAHARRRDWIARGRYRDTVARVAVIMTRSREGVYERCRDLARLGAVLDRRAKIDILDDGHARWTLPGGLVPAGRDATGRPGGENPAGQGRARPVICHVSIIGDVPLLLIAWRVTDGPFPHEGTVRFTPVDDERRVVVRVQLRYRWSARWARARGLDHDLPARTVLRALARLQLAPRATATTEPIP